MTIKKLILFITIAFANSVLCFAQESKVRIEKVRTVVYHYFDKVGDVYVDRGLFIILNNDTTPILPKATDNLLLSRQNKQVKAILGKDVLKELRKAHRSKKPDPRYDLCHNGFDSTMVVSELNLKAHWSDGYYERLDRKCICAVYRFWGEVVVYEEFTIPKKIQETNQILDYSRFVVLKSIEKLGYMPWKWKPQGFVWSGIRAVITSNSKMTERIDYKKTNLK